MSRFLAFDSKGREYVYGYDRPLMYYFLSRVKPRLQHIVGILSGTIRKEEVYGSASNLLEYLHKLKIEIPQRHRDELLLDLPLSEPPEEPEPFDSSLDLYGVG